MLKTFRLPTSLGVAVAIVMSSALPLATRADSDGPAAVVSASADNAATLYQQAIELLSREPSLQKLGPYHPFNEKTAAALDMATPALDLLHRAAAMPSCQWAQHVDVTDPATLGKLRQLAGIGVLAAKFDLKHDRPADAVADLLAVSAMGRHIGQTPLAMPKLVEVGIVASVLEELERMLPALPKDVVAALRAQLDALPDSATAAEVIMGEYRFARQQVRRGGTPGWNNTAVIAAKPFYEKIAASAHLPPDEFAAAVDAELAKLPPDQMFPRTVAPALKPLRVPIAKLEAMEAKLRASVSAAAK